MAETTGISWTDHTFNPWIGCAQVSPGCAHCYARDLAQIRMGLDVWDGKQVKPRRMLSEGYWKQPLTWNRKAKKEGRRHQVFCASMADVFEDRAELVPLRARLWDLILETPHLDWLLLTKRPENVVDMMLHAPRIINGEMTYERLDDMPQNVWLGTSVENQHWADVRIPILLSIPARVRFLSCEPLLGPLNITGSEPGYYPKWLKREHGTALDGWSEKLIHWVIVGGESGAKHRPMKLEWARELRDQCEAAGTAFFFKQVGGRTAKSGGDLLDGQQYHQFPITGNSPSL